MSTTTAEGPTILIGYPYELQLETDTNMFFDGASYVAQIRSKGGKGNILATLSTDNGGITRLSDQSIKVRISNTDTANMDVGSIGFDIVRSDTMPKENLKFMVEIPVAMPITKLD